MPLSRRAFRLPVPVEQNISIVYEDFILWQPVRSEEEQQLRFSVLLATPHSRVFKLNDQTEMHIEGVPIGSTDIELLIHKKKYILKKEGPDWKTTKSVTLTPELAAKQRRVRVRFSNDGRTHTIEPRLCLNLLGAAAIQQKQSSGGETIQLQPLHDGNVINRSEGIKYLRIWTPEEGKSPLVLEGDYRVGPLRYSKVKIQDIPGYGGELVIIDSDRQYPLGVHCQDRGCVRNFSHPMLGNPAKLSFLNDKNPDKPDYTIGPSGTSVSNHKM